MGQQRLRIHGNKGVLDLALADRGPRATSVGNGAACTEVGDSMESNAIRAADKKLIGSGRAHHRGSRVVAPQKHAGLSAITGVFSGGETAYALRCIVEACSHGGIAAAGAVGV